MPLKRPLPTRTAACLRALPLASDGVAFILPVGTEQTQICVFDVLRCESEARGSRRDMQPSPVLVRLTVEGKETAKAKLRHLLPQKAHC